MLDIFDNDAFSLMRLTAAINRIPEVPTRIGDLGVFDEQGIDTRICSIERRDESLTLVGSSAYGGPGEAVAGETRDMIDIRIPHFQRDDAVLAEEVQGKRAFGTNDQLETVIDRVNLKLARHTRSFDFTMENLRLGAISGQVLDKDGSTVLLDIFSKFGISPPSAENFHLDSSSSDVLGHCRTVLDAIEDALEGYQPPRVWGLMGDSFAQSLWTHTAVEKTYANWQAAIALRNDPRLPFEFGGISWVRYHTKPKAKAARANSPMISDAGVRFVAAGVPDLFITRYSPADYMETVNTIAVPRYAKQFPRRDDKGVELQMQTNAICLCTIPGALQSGVAS